MAKRISFLLFLMLTGAGALFDSAASKPQDRAPAPGSNKCVSCHSQLTGTSKISARYLEWHSSAHRAKAVGCEKCHGGDPTSSDLKKAHSGVLPPQNLRSRLHNTNLPETCGVCHKAVVSSFVESTHYVRLKDTGLGPSCIACHGHMASKIVAICSADIGFSEAALMSWTSRLTPSLSS